MGSTWQVLKQTSQHHPKWWCPHGPAGPLLTPDTPPSLSHSPAPQTAKEETIHDVTNTMASD